MARPPSSNPHHHHHHQRQNHHPNKSSEEFKRHQQQSVIVDGLKKKIEQCMERYMDKYETIWYLYVENGDPTHSTEAVWDYLEKLQPEFFRVYHLMQKTAIRIARFNELLMAQAKAMAQQQLFHGNNIGTAITSTGPNHTEGIPIPGNQSQYAANNRITPNPAGSHAPLNDHVSGIQNIYPATRSHAHLNGTVPDYARLNDNQNYRISDIESQVRARDAYLHINGTASTSTRPNHTEGIPIPGNQSQYAANNRITQNPAGSHAPLNDHISGIQNIYPATSIHAHLNDIESLVRARDAYIHINGIVPSYVSGHPENQFLYPGSNDQSQINGGIPNYGNNGHADHASSSMFNGINHMPPEMNGGLHGMFDASQFTTMPQLTIPVMSNHRENEWQQAETMNHHHGPMLPPHFSHSQETSEGE